MLEPPAGTDVPTAVANGAEQVARGNSAVDAPAGPLLRPDDEHNRKLVANVHPLGWINPEPRERYHMVVIGAGTAGLVSAAGAAGLGAKVALVERYLLGGDCLNYGCVPSKGIISAARAWQEVGHAAATFGAPRVDPASGGDFGTAMERMRRLRAHISSHDSADRFTNLGVDVFIGDGRFVGRDAVEVGSVQLRFRRAVIATGERPAVPPIPGLDQVDYLTNETIFSLTELPRRLGIVGAGPIGSEMAQTFARFGSRVTVLSMTDHILPREDAAAAAVVQDAMLRDGVDLQLGVKVTGVREQRDEFVVSFERDGETVELAVDRLLVAVGRVPNVEGLGLEAAGVEYGKDGVAVNHRLQTSNKRIFACGDIASRYKFTHTAEAQARIVIQNALFFGRAKASSLVVPWCTFTSPEIAHVGMYEWQAREAGYEMDTITVPLSEVDRAVLDGQDDGFLRVHVQKGKDRVLGATLVAAHAGEMIAELCLAITAGIGLEKISGTIHPYPTQAEVIKKAADTWRRTKLTPRVKKLFRLWFRLFS